MGNQVRVVAFSLPQLTQASFIQKNQMLQNRFFIHELKDPCTRVAKVMTVHDDLLFCNV